jgi:hypothetical protein
VRSKSILLVLLLYVLLIPVAHAAIIERIEANQDEYSNGDLVILKVYANKKNLIVNADFSKVDSNYDSRMVITESNDFQYLIYYPITFTNLRADKTYNAVITAYDPGVDSTSSLSYGIIMNNDLRTNKTSDFENIRLKVRSAPVDEPGKGGEKISVENGQVMICRPDGCSTLTESEYDLGREILVNAGQIKLNNKTYNDLKAQIQKGVTEEIRNEIKSYISAVADLNKAIESSMIEVKEIITNNEIEMHNTTMKTEKTLQTQMWVNIATIVLVILLIVSSFFVWYVKNYTTWLS